VATQLREHAAQLAAELEAQRTEVSPRTHRAVPTVLASTSLALALAAAL